MEKYTGDLFQLIEKNIDYNKNILINQLVKVYTHLWKNGFTHNDIKLENILYNIIDNNIHIYLCDFESVQVDKIYDSIFGTKKYLSPQVIYNYNNSSNNIYTDKLYSPSERLANDGWSLGILIVILYIKEYIFNIADSSDYIYKAYLNSTCKQQNKKWLKKYILQFDNVDYIENHIDLISNLLQINYKSRLNFMFELIN